MCGNDIPTPIFSTDNEMFLEFRTGSKSGNESGFKLNVAAIGIL